MEPLFSIVAVLMLGGLVFVPVFVVAMVMLGTAARAFVLAATFTMGAMAGFFGGLLLGGRLIPQHAQEHLSQIYLYAFAGAGGVAGGVIGVYLLGRIARYPPWRRR